MTHSGIKKGCIEAHFSLIEHGRLYGTLQLIRENEESLEEGCT